MSYNATVLEDSISPDGVRLLTLEVVFPRFILAEINTHRMLSRNSASSRAIPPEKQIRRVLDEPFIPETFNLRVKGMGVGEPLTSDQAIVAQSAWLSARDAAVEAAYKLIEKNVDKSRVNRLLEPFMWHTAIISATEWDNFFALRDHPAAQPEFQITARLMREAIEASSPQTINYGEWHLPLSQGFPYDEPNPDWELWKNISASRCARVSYDTQHDNEPLAKTLERAETLKGNGHLSPFEHVARPMGKPGLGHMRPEYAFVGNFRGWVQFRKEIPHEDNFGKLIADD